MVEQSVEVPTILSFASLQQQTVERTVNIPVPRGRGGSGGGGGGGLHGFLPGQSHSLPSEQIVDNPALRGGGGGGPQGFLEGQNPAAFVEQSVDIPVPGGAFHDFHPDPRSAASSAPG